MDAFFKLLGRGTRPGRFVGSADSLPVLDPKPGDVVEGTADGKTTVKRLGPKDFPLTGTGYQALRRSGKPFFTPERAGE